jgi:hypothetical protein
MAKPQIRAQPTLHFLKTHSFAYKPEFDFKIEKLFFCILKNVKICALQNGLHFMTRLLNHVHQKKTYIFLDEVVQMK